MMNGMYGMQNGMMQRSAVEEPPAKRFKPGQAQAVMQGNHGTSLIEAMNALEIQSHLDTLKVPDSASFTSICSQTTEDKAQGLASLHGRMAVFVRGVLGAGSAFLRLAWRNNSRWNIFVRTKGSIEYLSW